MQRKGRKRFDETVSEPTRLEVSDGYCHGACLHWLRISLGSDSRALEISHKDAELVSRMAVTQFKWTRLLERKSEIVREFNVSKIKQWFSAAAEETLSELAQWLERLRCDYSFSIVLPPDESEIEWRPRKGVRLDPHTRLEIQKRIDEVLKSLPGEAQSLAFDKAKSALPNKLRRLREAPLGKRTAKLWTFMEPRLEGASGERHFEAMLPVVGCDGYHTGRISEFLCEALAAPSLTEGRGVLITFMCGAHNAPATIEQPKGHAVAIVKVCDQSYFLFDPNLGVYRFDGVRKLIAGLILLLVDCYFKRSVAQEDDWLLFAKSEQLAPTVLTGGGQLFNRMLLDRDNAVKDLRDYLVVQTRKAYEVACQFLKARETVKEFAERSKEQLTQFDSGKRELSELEAFRREWQEASRREAELRREAEKHCQQIRTFLTSDSKGSGIRLDEDGLRRFVEAEGDISETALRELHDHLGGSI